MAASMSRSQDSIINVHSAHVRMPRFAIVPGWLVSFFLSFFSSFLPFWVRDLAGVIIPAASSGVPNADAPGSARACV